MTTVVEFLKAGTTAWTVPEGVSSVQVECLGAGGRGRTVNGSTSSGNRRSSGGGGGYSASTLAVVPGTVIPVQVGTNTAAWFSSNSTVLANRGGDGQTGTSGTASPRGIGDITFIGGAGASTTQMHPGGGGGGAAGPSGNGWPGTTGGGGGGSNGGLGSGGSGASGGSGSLGGGVAAGNGAGGSRGGTGVNGSPGTMQSLWLSTAGESAGPGGGGGSGNYTSGGVGGDYGGGGGGGGGAGGEPYTAGLGGEGLIVLTYTIAQPGFSHSYWL